MLLSRQHAQHDTERRGRLTLGVEYRRCVVEDEASQKRGGGRRRQTRESDLKVEKRQGACWHSRRFPRVINSAGRINATTVALPDSDSVSNPDIPIAKHSRTGPVATLPSQLATSTVGSFASSAPPTLQSGRQMSRTIFFASES